MKKLPSIFERIFLSHLLLLAVAFGIIYWAFRYLFGTGYRMLLLHDPAILIPVALLLLGLAGFLAAWVSRVIGLPIERASDHFRTGEADLPGSRVEEVEELLRSIRLLAEGMHDRKSDVPPGPAAAKDPYRELRPAIASLARIVERMEQIAPAPEARERLASLKEQVIRLTILTLRRPEPGTEEDWSVGF